MKWDPRDCHSGLSGARSEQRAGKLTYCSRSLEAWGFCSHVGMEHHGCSKPSSQVPPPLNIALTCPLIPPLTPRRSYISANWWWAQVTQGQCLMLSESCAPRFMDPRRYRWLHISLQHRDIASRGGCLGFWSQLVNGNDRWCQQT